MGIKREYLEKVQPVLAAWAIYLPHEEAFDLLEHPSLHGTPVHGTVMDEYVAWAEARACEAGLPFWAMDHDTVLARLMVERGFEVVPLVQLPDGFTVQGVKSRHDGRLRASVMHGAFGTDNDWDGYAAEYAQFVGSDVYNGDAISLCVRPMAEAHRPARPGSMK